MSRIVEENPQSIDDDTSSILEKKLRQSSNDAKRKKKRAKKDKDVLLDDDKKRASTDYTVEEDEDVSPEECRCGGTESIALPNIGGLDSPSASSVSPSPTEGSVLPMTMFQGCFKTLKRIQTVFSLISRKKKRTRAMTKPGSGATTYYRQNLQGANLKLFTLYAMVGLHRYNMLNGTNWDLYDLKKVTKRGFCCFSFFLTFDAYDPAIHGFGSIGDSQKKTFQVLVEEKRTAGLCLICSIARPLGEGSPEDSLITPYVMGLTRSLLPDWPSKSDVDDTKRFYVVDKEEWLCTNDWIYFYLYLVVSRHKGRLPDSKLFNMEIVQVAIETFDEQEEVEPLKAKSAFVYIKFKKWDKADCKAIVGRVIDKGTGRLSLMGKKFGFRPDDEQPSITPQW